MRTTLFTVFFILAGSPAFAQTETAPRPYFAGGSVNFLVQRNTYPVSGLAIGSVASGIYSSSNDDISYRTVAVSPYLGRSLSRHWSMGLQMEFRYGYYLARDVLYPGIPFTLDIERTSKQLGFGIFGRYVLQPDSRLQVFVQPYSRFNRAREIEKASLPDRETKSLFLDTGLTGGALYQISDRWRATVRLGSLSWVVGNWTEKSGSASESNNFNSVGGIFNLSSVYFGVEMCW